MYHVFQFALNKTKTISIFMGSKLKFLDTTFPEIRYELNPETNFCLLFSKLSACRVLNWRRALFKAHHISVFREVFIPIFAFSSYLISLSPYVWFGLFEC